MTGTCCSLHTNTCGQLDVCCDRCPSARDSLPRLFVAAFLGVLLLVLGWVAAA